MSIEITIEHQAPREGFTPTFNIALHSKVGTDPFLVLKGCRIANGPKGPFVSGPATKNASTGAYWNHAYLGDKFAAIVLSKAQESMPREERKAPSHDGFKARQLAPRPRPTEAYGTDKPMPDIEDCPF